MMSFLESFLAAHPATAEKDPDQLPTLAQMKDYYLAFLETERRRKSGARTIDRSFMSGRTSAGH